MYTITKMRDGTWYCECRIQDGTEKWSKPTRKEATESMISAARTLNNTFIPASAITFLKEGPPEPIQMSEKDFETLKKIKSGRFKFVPYDDPYFKYNVTLEECKLIQDIREGKVTTRRAK